MSKEPDATPRPLPDRPNLRHLKDQAKDLVAGWNRGIACGCAVPDRASLPVRQLAQAQGLRRVLERGRTTQAGDRQQRSDAGAGLDDAQPRAALRPGWVRKGWAADVGGRVPRAVGGAGCGETRHGGMDDPPRLRCSSGGDGPLMRAALNGCRIPMMELLVSHGADVNAWWHGSFPIIFAACEALDPVALRWLVSHGADPNCQDHGYETGGHAYPGTALDFGCRLRTFAGAAERVYRDPTHGGWGDQVRCAGRAGPAPVTPRRTGSADRRRSGTGESTFPAARLRPDRRTFAPAPGSDAAACRAEYGDVEAAALLLDRGADVNARATRGRRFCGHAFAAGSRRTGKGPNTEAGFARLCRPEAYTTTASKWPNARGPRYGNAPVRRVSSLPSRAPARLSKAHLTGFCGLPTTPNARG